MRSGADLLKLAGEHVGERYVNMLVPKDHAGWKGPWDCAEFVSWGIYQVTGHYVGTRGRRDDAWTGYFAEDLPRVGTRITADEDADCIGAIALRPRTSGRIGHIAVSRGGGRTIEAASTRLGVASLSMKGRGFTEYYTLNSLVYDMACGFM